MYNIEQINLLIEYREKRLQELRSQNNNTNQNEIDLIEEELKSLRIYKARYEIAKIIGYQDNELYKNINYVGIENENFASMNLTSEQLNDITNLVSQIPGNDALLFRKRLEIARLLGQDNDELLRLDNYQDIEDVDQTSMQYRLTQDEIDTIDRLKNDINALKQNHDVTYINYNNITINTINELMVKLNTMSTDQYNSDKEEDLEMLKKLLDIAYSTKEFKQIDNYEFGSDLISEYPDSTVQMNVDGINNLIDLLNSNGNIEEDKYNSYVSLIVNNINRLQSENKEDDVNNIICRIDRTNYSLRSDLLSRVSHDELNIKDSEVDTIFNYLDNNYDNLSKEKRDKIYEFLLNKLNIDLGNLDRVNKTNKLLLNVKNNNFKERLRSSLGNNHRAEFNDQHVSSFSSLIDDRIKALQKKKELLLKKPTGIMDAHYHAKIKEIDKEIEKLQKIKINYDSSLLKGLDDRYNVHNDKIIEIEKQMAELNALKRDIKSNFQRRRIEEKIKKLNSKILVIQNKQKKIIGQQKKIMAPKLWVEMKRGMFDRKFESRAEAFKDYSEDYDKLAKSTRKMSGMFSDIKAMFYEFQSGRFKRKSEFNRSMIDFLSRPGNQITVNGRNKKKIRKQTLQQLRNANQQQRTATQTI